MAKEIRCAMCDDLVGRLAKGSLWDNNSRSLCNRCYSTLTIDEEQNKYKVPNSTVDDLMKLFGMK